jgi:ABC-type multidrug transport system ATPase subunit
MTPSLRVHASNLEYAFSNENAERFLIFQDFQCEIEFNAKHLTVLQGPNGVGKSVLAKLIARIYKPHRGHLTVTGDGVRKRANPIILYIPQNLEVGFDRYAMDLFLSIASLNKSVISPVQLLRALRRAGVPWRERYRTCDKVDRVALLLGILASAAVSELDLLILDEPLSQFDARERNLVNEGLELFLPRARFPTLVVAHPEHMPSGIGQLLVLEATSNSQKAVRQLDPRTANRLLPNPVNGPTVMSIHVTGPGNTQKQFDALGGTVNRFLAPASISAGRLAALIAQSLRRSRKTRWRKWVIRTELAVQKLGDDQLTVRLLPAQAQTSVVLSSAPLAESTLFDRWEDAPVLHVSRRLDRARLNRNWFSESAAFLPIEHENPTSRGGTLSGGNRQLLALRTVAYPFPDVLILASPYAGLDEINFRRVNQFLEFAAASGVVVLVVESGE